MSERARPLSIAMVGTRGVPARYGGFETAVEEVGSRLAAAGHRVRVYCRNEVPASRRYRGMELVRLPALRYRTLETLSHSGLSVAHVLGARVDVVLCFNAANAPWLGLLRAARVPAATHVDGLEWRRAKWGGAGRRYYRVAEQLAVRWSDALIADAPGIGRYYRAEFDADTVPIAYGAPLLADAHSERLAELGLTPHGYHLAVARFEPENHLAEIVGGYAASAAQRPLVVVGTAPYADRYTGRVHDLADGRTRLLGAVWDQELLDALYANAYTYLHGHSVGGTNPSLLRAIGAGAATAAFDVAFNHDVLGDDAWYFRTPADVAARVEAAEAAPDLVAARSDAVRRRAAGYDWDDVASRYEALCRRLVARRPHRRPSGRRFGRGEDELLGAVPGEAGEGV